MMAEDPEFRVEVSDALSLAPGQAEEALFDRAVNGTQKPVMYRGEPVPRRYPEGHELEGQVVLDENGDPVYHIVTEYSPRLLEIYLRGALPEKYAGAESSPETLAPRRPVDLSVLSDEELERLDDMSRKVYDE